MDLLLKWSKLLPSWIPPRTVAETGKTYLSAPEVKTTSKWENIVFTFSERKYAKRFSGGVRVVGARIKAKLMFFCRSLLRRIWRQSASYHRFSLHVLLCNCRGVHSVCDRMEHGARVSDRYECMCVRPQCLLQRPVQQFHWSRHQGERRHHVR